MFPSFDLGPWHIHTYSFINTLALLIAGTYGFHRLLNGIGQPANIVIRGVILTILGGFAGLFLVRLVLVLQRYLTTGILAWAEGSSFIGLLVFGSGTAVIYVRRHKVPVGRAFDLGGMAVPLGQFIARFACLGAGCCYGKATDSWLGMYLRDSNGVWLDRYPTQLMSAAANLLIFIGLVAFERYGLRRKREKGLAQVRMWPFDGFLFLFYVDLYCLKRFIMEFLRGDVIPVIGPITWVHLYTVGGLVAVTAVIVWNLRRCPPNRPPSLLPAIDGTR